MLVSQPAQVEQWGESWLAGAVDALATAEARAGDESWSHYERATAARLLASAAAASTGSERDTYLDGALLLLERLDTGYWQWGWYQGRALPYYAVAYDVVAELLVEREAADPHTWAPRHAAIRCNLLALGHQVYQVGSLDEDG